MNVVINQNNEQSLSNENDTLSFRYLNEICRHCDRVLLKVTMYILIFTTKFFLGCISIFAECITNCVVSKQWVDVLWFQPSYNVQTTEKMLFETHQRALQHNLEIGVSKPVA